MKKDVLVDLDGVLADYSEGWQGIDKIGEPIKGAVKFTKDLSEFARVVIYTTRCKSEVRGENRGTPEELSDKVRSWLNKHGFHFDEIYVGQGKPLAAAIIDDRAISCEPQNHKGEFEFALTCARALCGG